MTTKQEVLKNLAEEYLCQIDKDTGAAKVKTVEFYKTKITKETRNQFLAELNQDLKLILNKVQVYDILMQEYENCTTNE